MPAGRLACAFFNVPQAARSFKRAEIRLHQVPQLMRSCFVRAFLNEPGADASTRTGMQTAQVYVAKRRVQKMLQDEVRKLEGAGPDADAPTP